MRRSHRQLATASTQTGRGDGDDAGRAGRGADAEQLDPDQQAQQEPGTEQEPDPVQRADRRRLLPGTIRPATTNATTPSGRLIKKIHGQLATETIQPPRAGASTGASSAGQVR